MKLSYQDLELGLDHRINLLGVLCKANNSIGEEINGARISRMLPAVSGLVQVLFVNGALVVLVIALQVERGSCIFLELLFF